MTSNVELRSKSLALMNRTESVVLERHPDGYYMIAGEYVCIQETTSTAVTLSTKGHVPLQFITEASPFWAFIVQHAPGGVFTKQQVACLVGVSATTIKNRLSDKKIVPIPSQPDRVSQLELERYILYRNTYPHGHRVNDCQLPGM